MVADVSAARGQLAAIKRQARADTDKAAAAADAKMREYVDKFREQVWVGVRGWLCVLCALVAGPCTSNPSTTYTHAFTGAVA
jgi:hypothetical protein